MKLRAWAFIPAIYALLFSTAAPAFSAQPAAERDADGNTPLHLAAQANHGYNGTQINQLIAAGADVNATNFLGQTPLHLAVSNMLTGFTGSVSGFETFPALIGAGAKVDARDHNGLTPLLLAAATDGFRRKDVLRALLEAGADPNAHDQQGRTALHLLLGSQWPWTEVSDALSLLAIARADFSAKDNAGKTPLHCLAAVGARAQDPFFFINNLGTTLTVARVDCSARDHHGDTPLHVAARHGARGAYEWLLQHGASLDATNNVGETPRQLAGPQAPMRFSAEIDIYEAARTGNLARLKDLLKQDPALLNKANQGGETPLRAATFGNHIFIQDFLVQAGAQWDEVSASAANRADELQAILARTPACVSNNYLLQIAVERNASATAELLLTAGADVNAPNQYGLSPLGKAALGHRTTMVNLLQQHQARTNIFDAVYLNNFEVAQALLAENQSLARATNGNGFTPAEIAVATEPNKLLGLLLDHGAALEGGGTRALAVAALFNRPDAAEQLIQHGAILESFDDQGLTPLQLAVKHHSTETAAVILKHKQANPDTPASFLTTLSNHPMPPSMARESKTVGNTAMHFAAINEDTNMIAMLLQAGASVNVTNQSGNTPLDFVCGPRMGPPPGFFRMQNRLAYLPPELLRPADFENQFLRMGRVAAEKMLRDAGAQNGPNFRPFGAPRFGPRQTF